MALETARLHPHKHKGLVSQDANVEISPRNGKSTQRTGTWRTLYLFLDKLYTRNFPSTYLCNYESSRYLHWTSYNQFPWKLKKKKKKVGKAASTGHTSPWQPLQETHTGRQLCTPRVILFAAGALKASLAKKRGPINKSSSCSSLLGQEK